MIGPKPNTTSILGIMKSLKWTYDSNTDGLNDPPSVILVVVVVIVVVGLQDLLLSIKYILMVYYEMNV